MLWSAIFVIQLLLLWSSYYFNHTQLAYKWTETSKLHYFSGVKMLRQNESYTDTI